MCAASGDPMRGNYPGALLVFNAQRPRMRILEGSLMNLTFSFDETSAVTDTGLKLTAASNGLCGDCALWDRCPGTAESRCLPACRKDRQVIIWKEAE